ncbi:MAG: DUF962 domain-containing protein [Chitinophagales bacterium]|nr:DUF962 domain-containing protein [Chitinophagales bacterium]MDW8419629.1 DUF962 domain-containing protein [Chitinophagales bacterium]
MRSIHSYLEEYAASHRHPLNKKIHWVCVPLIFFTIIGFLYCIPLPLNITTNIQLNAAHLALLFITIYYFLLSPSLSVGMLLFLLVCLAGCYLFQSFAPVPLWALCAFIFVVAWIFQFYGHNVEGARPSFLKDLQFLMIGPAWLMSFIYARMGIRL